MRATYPILENKPGQVPGLVVPDYRVEIQLGKVIQSMVIGYNDLFH